MTETPTTTSVLDKSDFGLLYTLGETILGVPREQLGKEFIEEADAFLENLDDFLIKDFKRLLTIFNSRISSLFIAFSITPFENMKEKQREQYFNKWSKSRISLLRTGASSLRALCGWSYYSLEKEWDEMNYPGRTIGREDETPTLLDTKWKEGMVVDT